MSHVIHCDGGCGFHSKDAEDFKKIGTVHPNEYCEDCSELASDYLRDVDTLQEELQKQWATKFSKVFKKHKKIMDKGVLPNEFE